MKPTVLDLFCGAGGFSLGFQQAGYTIAGGADNWQPAIDTFNHAYGLNGVKMDMLGFEHNADKVNDLANTSVIIGSPPCVNFSVSNRHKNEAEGMRFIKTFLRVVAIKKHQPNSQLESWVFEQIPRVRKYLKARYTFEELGLSAWATAHNINPQAVALQPHIYVLNSSDYGTPQHRRRLFIGEGWSVPPPTHRRESPQLSIFPLPRWRTIRDVRDMLDDSLVVLLDHDNPKPLSRGDRQKSFKKKQGNDYMGALQPVEPLDKPSRAVMSKDIRGARECLIFEDNKGGWRTPTIRECASLMGYPLDFEFLGKSPSAKRMLVGNSVCPPVSFAIAKRLKQERSEQKKG